MPDNILVTGAKGFIGQNLIAELNNRSYGNVFEYDIDSTENQLKEYIKKCDFVFHLAGVNRPKEDIEFMQGNFGFTSTLLNLLEGEGLGTSYEYYVKFRRLKRFILSVGPPKKILIAGLPERYGRHSGSRRFW